MLAVSATDGSAAVGQSGKDWPHAALNIIGEIRGMSVFEGIVVTPGLEGHATELHVLAKRPIDPIERFHQNPVLSGCPRSNLGRCTARRRALGSGNALHRRSSHVHTTSVCEGQASGPELEQEVQLHPTCETFRLLSHSPNHATGSESTLVINQETGYCYVLPCHVSHPEPEDSTDSMYERESILPALRE